MSDLAREVQKNYAKHLIEEAKKRANKTISDAYELLEKENKQQADLLAEYERQIKVLADYEESPNAVGDRAVAGARSLLVNAYNKRGGGK